MAAAVALVALITSPVVAETRLFCRYTGIEVTDCVERQAPPAPVITDAECCEHRVSVPLDRSKVAERQALAPALVPQVAASRVLLSLVPARAGAPRAAAGAGPPLFVQHRALLI